MHSAKGRRCRYVFLELNEEAIKPITEAGNNISMDRCVGQSGYSPGLKKLQGLTCQAIPLIEYS
mgnify:FL=1